MYSVIRFVANDNSINLYDFGNAINKIIPNSFNNRLDYIKTETRFSCSVSEKNNWNNHKMGIIDYITKCSNIINNFVNQGHSVILDIAIEPEDYSNKMICNLYFDLNLMEILISHKIILNLSVYEGKRLSD